MVRITSEIAREDMQLGAEAGYTRGEVTQCIEEHLG